MQWERRPSLQYWSHRAQTWTLSGLVDAPRSPKVISTEQVLAVTVLAALTLQASRKR